MKGRLPLATTAIAIAIGLAYGGMILSMLLTADPRWMEWHLSRLGEGGHASSAVFNSALVLTALALFVFGLSAAQNFAKRFPRAKFGRFLTCIATMNGCLIGVASFPFDQSHVLHNVFGYGFFLATGVLLMSGKRVLPTISERHHQFGLIAAFIISLLMILHHTARLTPLLTVELVGQFLLFAWLTVIAFDAEGRSIAVLYRGRIRSNKA